MSRAIYSPIPLSREASIDAAAEEMERAFTPDEADQEETTPLAPARVTPTTTTPSHEGLAYDFERDYDIPPPGSPPAVHSTTHIALSNSNGIVPSPSSIVRPEPAESSSRPSFFRRTVGALLPQYYSRLPTSDPESRITRGSGVENDGVFANVLAKPVLPSAASEENGDVHVMPEDTQKDAPPSYAAAQADSAPPYWETTVHAPGGGADDLLIDGVPAGTVFSFAWNFMISMSFQFVGFMLTYLLHTTHAAKYGSRAGLGVTLIQYGFYSRAYDTGGFGDGSDSEAGDEEMGGQAVRLLRRGASAFIPRMYMGNGGGDMSQNMMRSTTLHDWISFLLMTIGWFLLLSSVMGFARVKRWERGIRAPPSSPPAREETREEVRAIVQIASRSESGPPLTEEQMNEAVEREFALRRDLRMVGFIS